MSGKRCERIIWIGVKGQTIYSHGGVERRGNLGHSEVLA